MVALSPMTRVCAKPYCPAAARRRSCKGPAALFCYFTGLVLVDDAALLTAQWLHVVVHGAGCQVHHALCERPRARTLPESRGEGGGSATA